MSVLIKGVKMPKGCLACPFMFYGRDDYTMWCQWLDEPLGEWGKRRGKWRHPDCPLVEVPAPHGPLVDAEALKEWSELVPLTNDGGIDINDFDENLVSMPAIIEAEEGEEE